MLPFYARDRVASFLRLGVRTNRRDSGSDGSDAEFAHTQILEILVLRPEIIDCLEADTGPLAFMTVPVPCHVTAEVAGFRTRF